MILIKNILIISGLFVLVLPALPGQNTSSVFSPDVSAGSTDGEYRAALDPAGDAFAHRLHLQHGFTDSWRMRLILQQSKNMRDNLEFRYARWEGQWQFLEDQTAGWDGALRFEVQLADSDDLPSRVRVAWTGKVDLDEDWQLRGNFLTGHQLGEGAKGGYLLETRVQVSRKLSDNWRLAADYFGDLNTTESIGSFDDQEHQLGPLLKFKAGQRWSGFFGLLYGISDAAPEREWRLSLIAGF